MSKDLSDFMAVLGERNDIEQLISVVPPDIQGYLREHLATFLKRPDLDDIFHYLLDRDSFNRIDHLLARLRRLAEPPPV